MSVTGTARKPVLLSLFLDTDNQVSCLQNVFMHSKFHLTRSVNPVAYTHCDEGFRNQHSLTGIDHVHFKFKLYTKISLLCFQLMEFYERVSGARMHAAYVRPGGVALVGFVSRDASDCTLSLTAVLQQVNGLIIHGSTVITIKFHLIIALLNR